MKKSNDPRHLKRRQNVQQLYALSFRRPSRQTSPQPIMTQLPRIDQIIKESAPTWPIDKINKVDLAILRQAIFELFWQKTIPFKVIIDEAVELAKEFGCESSPGFVNGVLGAVIKKKPPHD